MHTQGVFACFFSGPGENPGWKPLSWLVCEMVRLCTAKSGAHPREGRRGENGRHAVALHVLQYDMHSAAAVSITHRVSVRRTAAVRAPTTRPTFGGGEYGRRSPPHS